MPPCRNAEKQKEGEREKRMGGKKEEEEENTRQRNCTTSITRIPGGARETGRDADSDLLNGYTVYLYRY